uniref:Uncharacterized protein n=1 Tax=Oryza rufipogon TaxID=4529 RepID=A0A0E0RA78_ORYRU
MVRACLLWGTRTSFVYSEGTRQRKGFLYEKVKLLCLLKGVSRRSTSHPCQCMYTNTTVLINPLSRQVVMMMHIALRVLFYLSRTLISLKKIVDFSWCELETCYGAR